MSWRPVLTRCRQQTGGRNQVPAGQVIEEKANQSAGSGNGAGASIRLGQ